LIIFQPAIYVVASEHAFKTKGLRFGMRFFGGIETDRTVKGMSFIHQAATLLQKGQLVQIFPEGHNTPDGKLHPFYPSYLVLALMGGVPIIPVILDGNYSFKKRQHVLIGEPIDLADHFPSGKYTQADLERVNEQIYQHMLAMKQDLDERIAANER
jgi:1-acyl-sn-glycerol-3-phosphate acyltransferase